MRLAMIFGGKNNQPAKASGGDVSVIERFYHNSKSTELLVNIANSLRKSHYIVKCDNNLFPTEYIGDCLAFLNTGLDEVVHIGKFSTSKKQFFHNVLPVGGSLKVEMTPKQTVNYAIMAMEQSPTNEYENILPLMQEYRTIFFSSQIQNALDNIAKIA